LSNPGIWLVESKSQKEEKKPSTPKQNKNTIPKPDFHSWDQIKTTKSPERLN